ncbi:hypothetical protein C2W62_18510 [Candidatus Entotheonella serta]|nr:hypothetical protein C2W62_18510 [Candidatus Entotheonella serta]
MMNRFKVATGLRHTIKLVQGMALIAITVFGLSRTEAIMSTTIHVSAKGVDTPQCGIPNQPCRSIGQAIDRAQTNGTILVGPGYYGDINGDGDFNDPGDEAAELDFGCHCLVHVDKPLTILSTQGAEETVIDAAGVELNVVEFSADHITFGRCGEGFTITGAEHQLPIVHVTGVGLEARQVNDLYLGGNHISFNSMIGVVLEEVTESMVQGNTASHNNRAGFTFRNSVGIATSRLRTISPP